MIALSLLLAAAAADPGGQTRAENLAAARVLHERLDADRDGDVTAAEIAAAALAMVVPAGHAVDAASVPEPATARAAFAAADTNRDGRLSLAEDLAAADRAFVTADANHDGVLSAAERAAYAARSLAASEAEMRARTPLPCRAGAACSEKQRGR